VEPLETEGIPVRIFNIDGPKDALRPLSVIDGDEAKGDPKLKSVTYSDNFAILRVGGPGVGIKPGVLARLTERLDRSQINIKSVVTSQTAINLYLESSDLHRAYKSLQSLEDDAIIRIREIDGMSIVSVVGTGIAHEPQAAHRMLKALAEESIHTQIVSLGASDVAAYVVVAREDREAAVMAVHREFFD
jgi:aspartate kinase/aspartokinase/homoserine dehydrogenase 1